MSLPALAAVAGLAAAGLTRIARIRKEGPQVISVGPYMSLRPLIHRLKDREPEAIIESAQLLAQVAPQGILVIPVPSSRGDTRDMLQLALALQKIRPDIEVLDALRGAERQSSRTRKHRGEPVLRAQEMPMWIVEEVPTHREIFLLDNVFVTGETAIAALAAIGISAKMLVVAHGGTEMNTSGSKNTEKKNIELKPRTKTRIVNLVKAGEMDRAWALTRSQGLDFLDLRNTSGWKRMYGTDLSGADFSGSNVEYADFGSCNLSGSKMVGVIGGFTEFSFSDLTNADFSHSKFIASNFSNSKLIDTNFEESILYAADFTESTIDGTNFKNSNMKNSKIERIVGTLDMGPNRVFKGVPSGYIVRESNIIKGRTSLVKRTF